MRMWGVPPTVLCNKHLLGEHVEMHMFVGAINKHKSIAGFINGGLVNTSHIMQRHSDLTAEMLERGMRHKSPLPTFNVEPAGSVDVTSNLTELARRCTMCADRQKENLK